MRPGDLIFVDGLSHVGIYAGFGFIWHAPHTGARVRLSLIWDRNYRVARCPITPVTPPAWQTASTLLPSGSRTKAP